MDDGIYEVLRAQDGETKTLESLDAECAAELSALCDNPETDHVKADRLLLELLLTIGCSKTVAAFKKLEKWYS